MLDVSDLMVTYKNSVRALAGVSLQVGPGRIIALLGPNGAGKSTLLKSIAGLIAGDHGKIVSGDIRFEDQTIVGVAPHKLTRRGISYVHEGRRIFTELTVEENLVAATHALVGRHEKPDFDHIYELFPILAERRRLSAGYLSGGESQMLSIGRAVIANPKLILFDEPSLGLAPKMVETVFEAIVRINRELKVSMLVADQNVFGALNISSHGYVLEQGHIALAGPSQELASNPDIAASYLGGNLAATAATNTAKI